MKFKAAILTEINSPLIVDFVEPTDLKIGQVLVKIIESGLCGAQLQEIAGLKNNSKHVPHLLGHEGCGIVQDIGPGVTKVKKGDKVIMHWRKGEGIESPFPEYIYNGKKISSGKVTTLSEYSIVSENRLTPVDQSTNTNLCTLLGCGLSTALGVVNNDAKIKFGETVLVIGCGGVGLNIIQGCKLASAAQIYGLDILEDKKDLVEHYGGVFIWNNVDIFIQNNLSKIDCIIDTTGNMNIVSQLLPCLSHSGRTILVSQPKPQSVLSIYKPSNLFLGEGQSISTTQGGKTNPSLDLHRYIKLFNSQILTIDKIITHTFNLEEVNSAIDILKSGKAGRILVKMP